MNIFGLEISQRRSVKEKLIVKAHKQFRIAAQEAFRRDLCSNLPEDEKDEFYIWVASGLFNQLIHNSKDKEDINILSCVLKDRKKLNAFVSQTKNDIVGKRFDKINHDSEEIKKQNEDLLEMVKMAQKEVLDVRADAARDQERAAEDRKKDRRMAFVYCALSAGLAVALTAYSMSGKLVNDVEQKSGNGVIPEKTEKDDGSNVILQFFGCKIYFDSSSSQKEKSTREQSKPEVPNTKKDAATLKMQP